MFKTEQDLLNAVLLRKDIWEEISIDIESSYLRVEPLGLFGIPDVLIATLERDAEKYSVSTIYAIELKLSNWKRAIIQAFKYQAFSHMSYVLIDSERGRSAVKNIDEFKTCNIGLITFDLSGEIEIHHQPLKRKPFYEKYENKIRNDVESLRLLSTQVENTEQKYPVSVLRGQYIPLKSKIVSGCE